jgi:Ca2+-binding RTX toxin-like protein
MDTIDDQGLLTDRDTAIIPYQINSYQLPSNIENAVISEGTQKSNLIGNNANNSLTGNQGNNSLAGNVGADTLFGGLGNDKLVGGSGDDALTGDIGSDTLTGGLGQDDFIFANKPSKDNIDTITDFATPDDVINLDNAAFQKLSQEGEFNSRNLVLNDAAVDKNDFIIYNKATGVLFYDADGNGTIAAVQIAILGVDLTLTSDNFIII